VAYLSEEPPPGNLLIWKPHGACNLLPLDEIYNINVVAKQILEGPLRPVDLPEVRRRYAAGYSIPPAMSLFAPGKPTPVAPSFVAETRRQWATWIKSASLVIIIGARPLLADNHIWDPLLTGSVEVWYVGGTADDQYRDFKSRMGDRLIHIADRFPQGFGPLVRRLRDYVGS